MTDMKYVKELLTTDIGVEGQLLIPRKIHDTLIEEAQKKLIDRRFASFYVGPAMIPGSSYDIDLEDENKMKVRLIAEGGEIILDQDEYSNLNVKPLKYGVAIKITKEMQEDSKWPLLQRNVSKAGKRFAENETSLVLLQLDGAANTVAGGAAATIANINTAILNVEDADYGADTIILGNEFYRDLMNIDTFVEADKAGTDDAQKNGTIFRKFGLDFVRFSTSAAPSTTYSKYAYVFDSSEAYAIVEKRPITVENFDLVQMDMMGSACTQRIAIKLLRSNAVCKITTS